MIKRNSLRSNISPTEKKSEKCNGSIYEIETEVNDYIREIILHCEILLHVQVV